VVRTVDEIKTQHGASTAEILNSYHDTLDAIRAQREPQDGAYLDRLTDEQRMSLMREQKGEKASQAHEQAVRDYAEAVDTYYEDTQKKRQYIKKALFSVEGPDGAAALSRAITAEEGELEAYLDVAQQAGNKDLARAVFVAAQRRDLGNLMARYFDEVDPEARGLYQEWSKLPTEETIERQRESIPLLLPTPDPDSLLPRATAF
jgi:hypothetical protein